MKKLLIFILILMLYACHDKTIDDTVENASDAYIEITDCLSCLKFEMIRSFILEKGDVRDYRNMDSNHPHYSFNGFECYLNSEYPSNIMNDPLLSDFNQLVIQDLDSEFKYYRIQIVRRGDLKDSDIYIPDGMKEKRVYLLKRYDDDDLIVMKQNLIHYFEIMMHEIIQMMLSPNS